MKKKTYSEEQIIGILREANGEKTVVQICKDHNISDKTYYRWKHKYGRMEVADARWLRELERENVELKKIVADQLLNIKVLEHVNAKKW